MKATKLSLAALMALTCSANAKPLEEAIKDVEFSGMARFRVHDKEANNGNTQSDKNEIDIDLKFETKIDDNAKLMVEAAVAGDRKDTRLSQGKYGSKGAGVSGNDEAEFRMLQMYYQFTFGGLDSKIGRQAIPLPTMDAGYDGHRGDGITMDYHHSFPMSMHMGFFNTSNAVSEGSLEDDLAYYVGSGKGFDNGAEEADRGDLSYIGFSGSIPFANLQAHAMRMEDVIEAQYFGEFVSVPVGGFSFSAQGISTTLDDDTFGTTGKNGDVLKDDTGMYYAAKIDYKYGWFGADIGYTSNDEDQPIHSLSTDGDNELIRGGWRFGWGQDVTYSLLGGDMIFLNTKMKFGKWKYKFGYAYFEEDGGLVASTKDEELTEIFGKITYDHSKNLTTYVGYSDIKADLHAANEQKFFRWEIKYKF